MTMKRNYIVLLILLLVAMPAMLPAATFWDGVSQPVGQLLGVVLTIFGVPLLIKLGRKWGITIDEQLAQDAINALINVLVNIDLGSGDKDGKAKKQMAVLTARNTLSAEHQKILVKKYGSLEAAVQVAFERSSLNTGVK